MDKLAIFGLVSFLFACTPAPQVKAEPQASEQQEGAKQKIFDMDNPSFDVRVAVPIEFRAHDLPTTVVSITGESKRFTVESNDKTIVIREDVPSNTNTISVNGNTVSVSSGSGVVVSGNGVVVSGNGDVTISGSSSTGKVIVNGQEIEVPKTKPTRVVVTVPSTVDDLKLKLSGIGQFTSRVAFDEADVDASGSSKIHQLTAHSIEVEVHGSANVRTKVHGGTLEADVSDSADLSVDGEYQSVEVDASGASDVETSGVCHGDYEADASGASEISHRGSVQGNIDKDTSGAASISIN